LILVFVFLICFAAQRSKIKHCIHFGEGDLRQKEGHRRRCCLAEDLSMESQQRYQAHATRRCINNQEAIPMFSTQVL